MKKTSLPENAILLTGWLVDGTGDPPVSRVWIVIRKRIIQGIFVDPRQIPRQGYPDGEPPVLDFSACTLMPGWMDCHVHLTMSGIDDPEIRKAQVDSGYPEASVTISRHLRDHFRWGIAVVRDGGDRHGHVLRYRGESVCENRPGTRFRAAGKAWHAAGRYGRLIGRHPDPENPLIPSIRADLNLPDQWRPDHVKIINSGLNSLKTYGKQTSPQFRPDEMTAVVRETCEAGIPVMVHANGIEPVRIALEAGCTSIEHGFFMNLETMRQMADREVFWAPTAVTMKMYAECFAPGSLEADTARRNLEHQVEQMSIADRVGVRMVLGTDSGSLGVFHGRSAAEELKLMLEAGLSVSRAVRCAAFHGSQLLRVPDLGTVEPGKRAVFTVIDGPPHQIPIHLETIRGLS